MNLKTIGILLTVVIMQGCGVKKNAHLGTKTMWISGYQTICDARAGKSECMLVSTKDNLAEAKWENFYNTIAGFTFEPGFLQKVEVSVEELPVAEIAADRSSLNYTLIKVLEKKKDVRVALEGSWTLNKIDGLEVKTSTELPILHVDLKSNQISGNNGCNNFSRMIQKIDLEQIQIGHGLTTLKSCIDNPIATTFDKALAKIISYKVDNNKLSFYDENKNEVLTWMQKPTAGADIRIHDIYVAVEINGEKISKRDEMPRFEINLNSMQVFGNNGCNEFSGAIKAVTEQKISFGAIASTRKMCRDMEVPAKFDKALIQTASYKFEDLHLSLYDNNGKELIRFLKVD